MDDSDNSSTISVQSDRNRKKRNMKKKKERKEKYICELCGKTFSRNFNLKRHIHNYHVNLNQVF